MASQANRIEQRKNTANTDQGKRELRLFRALFLQEGLLDEAASGRTTIKQEQEAPREAEEMSGCFPFVQRSRTPELTGAP